MMKKAKLLTALFAAFLMLLAFTACGSSGQDQEEAAQEEATASEAQAGQFTNDGMVLTVPAEYQEIVTVETPENDKDGILFKVAEKASIEAAEQMESADVEGAGWLFSIGRVDEDTLHEMLCGEMSGAIPFARDEDGQCYVYYHPTDVRLIRADNDEMEAAMDSWTALNEWAASTRDTFIEENKGLNEVTFGNTDLEIYLNQIAYQGKKDYTISTTEAGPMKPGDTDPLPFTGKLLNGAVYEEADDAEAPDGEYVVLAFPKDNVRFDFFQADGQENLIRRVWGENDENEQFYKAVYEDNSVKASEVMQDWYHAVMK